MYILLSIAKTRQKITFTEFPNIILLKIATLRRVHFRWRFLRYDNTIQHSSVEKRTADVVLLCYTVSVFRWSKRMSRKFLLEKVARVNISVSWEFRLYQLVMRDLRSQIVRVLFMHIALYYTFFFMINSVQVSSLKFNRLFFVASYKLFSDFYQILFTKMFSAI